MAGEFDSAYFDPAFFDTGSSTSLTADAVLRRTQTGSLTASAVISRASSGPLTADAWIRRTQTGSLAADAVLKRAQAGSFTGNAVFRVSRSGSFAADAVINALTISGSLTANAVLRRTQAGSLAADARIKRTQAGSLTADAVISFRSFTADALIVRQIEFDDFNRSVAEGLGGRYHNDAGPENRASVNGSEAVVFGTNSPSYYETASGYHRPYIGYLQFDFVTPSDLSDSSWYLAVDAKDPNGALGLYSSEVELYFSGTPGRWAADIYPSNLYYEFAPDPSTWYTIKGYFESVDGGAVGIKVWKRSDPEPQTWSAQGIHGTHGFSFWQSKLWLDAFHGVGEDAKIDNLRAWAASSDAWEFRGYLTADAILKDWTGQFTADAVIRKIVGNGTTTAPAVGSGTTLGNGSGPGNGAALPTGVANGDLMIAFISYDSEGDSTRTWTGPSGWTLLTNALLSNGDQGLAVFAKVKTASDSGIQSFSASGSGSTSRMVIVRVTGADLIDPIALIGSALDTSSVTSHATSSITSPLINALLLLGAAGSLSNSWTPPSGMTEQSDGTFGSWVSLAVDSLTITDTAVGVKTTISSSAVASALVWLIIRSPGRYFAANASIRKISTGSLTANAALKRTQAHSFTADATISVVVVTGAFTANAAIKASRSSSFTANAWIYAPRTDPGGPGVPPGPGNPGDPGYQAGETPLVSIRVGGVDVTADVVLDDATFTMQVNGAPGSFMFRVKDVGHTHSFVSGAEVTVDYDGKRKFGGYLMTPHRKFAFASQDTTVPGSVARFWVLEGVDYNILFRKRVLRDLADPADVTLRSWPAGSRDDVVIKYVFDHYTDLGADGVTYDGVTHVGSPNPDKTGVIGSGGLYFGDAMTEINRLINGVFYIDQYKDLHFVDTDTADASIGLSDFPGDGEIGYRELVQVSDGSKLANDALLWGTGLGAKRMVFSRSQSSSSIAAHKRWQYGEFTTSIFRQASIDERAHSVVYGTDQSHRGGKDDQESWTLITFNPAFSVGQKVAIESEVFGKSDVLPIRRMTMTFPTRTSVRLQLVLSYEIDQPWNTFEVAFPRLGFPGVTIPNLPPIDGFPPVVTEGGCDCGVTDSFNRTVELGFGTSDSGAVWDSLYGEANGASVSGGMGHIPVNGNAFIPLPVSGSLTDFTMTARISSVAGGEVAFFIVQTDGVDSPIEVDFYGTGTVEMFTDDDDVVAAAGFTPDTLFKIRILITSDTTAECYVWPASDPQPSTPTTSITSSGGYGSSVSQVLVGASGGTFDFYIDSLEIPGFDRCTRTARLDNFDRVVSGSWGVSERGHSWVDQFVAGVTGVDGGAAYAASGGVGGRYLYDVEPFGTGNNFVLTSRIRVTTWPPEVITQIVLRVEDLSGNNVMLQLNGGGGNLGGSLTYADDTGDGGVSFTDVITDTAWYNVKLDASVMGLKIWREFTDEPAGWMWTIAPSPGGFTPVRFYMVLQNPTACDYLNVEYAGKNCYDCGGDLASATFSDTFTRTTGPLDMGTSDTGQTYDIFRNGRTPTAIVETTGSTGRINVPHPTSFDSPADDTAIDWNGTYLPGHIVISFKLKINSQDLSQTDVTPFIDVGLGPIDWNLEFGAPTYDIHGTREHGQRLQIISFGSSPNHVDLFGYVLTTGVWYQTKMENNPGVVTRLKIWPVGDPEPISWTISTTAVGQSSSSGDFEIYVEQGGSDVTHLGVDLDIEFDDLQIGPAAEADCAGAAADAGSSSTGSARNDLVGDGTDTYTLTSAYAPGSTRVFIDGFFKRPGLDYTETDPAAGVITFPANIVEAAQITVFYEVSGAL